MAEVFLNEILDFALVLSREAGQFILPLWKNVAVEGKVDGSEVTEADGGAEQTLRKLWQKLMRSCGIHALELATEGAESVAPEEISKWLESSASATEEPFPSPGIGVDVRIEGKDVIGVSFVIDDHPIHIELFRRPASQQAAASDE